MGVLWLGSKPDTPVTNSSCVSENDASYVRITGKNGSTGKLDRGAYTEPERENRTLQYV